MAVAKTLRVTINFYKKKESYSQDKNITYTLEKMFVVAATFEGLWVTSFQESIKTWVHFGALYISREEKTK